MSARHAMWKELEAAKEARLERMRATLRRAYAAERQGDLEQAQAYGAEAANRLALVVGTDNRVHVLEVIK